MEANVEKQLELIKRGAVEIISEEELTKKLRRAVETKKPLVIKAGFDPSAPDIHLGHTVLLRKLRQLQDLGHQVVFLIGDFTGRIGDPTGRSELRPQLTKEQVLANAKTYQMQAFKILDKRKTKIAFNSEWLEKMSVSNVLELAAHSTVAQLLARADFKERFQQKADITILEFMYPLLQGYDSVQLHADVEIGGTDQKFNLLIARELQRDYKQEPQVIIMMPLLEGIDGTQKMSKSLGNYIGINEPPKEIFGKAMSIPDELMFKYYELLTDVPLEEIESMKKGLKDSSLHPKDLKKKLSRILVSMYCSEKEAAKAEEEFERVFKHKEIPEEIREFRISEKDLEDGKVWIVKLMLACGLAPSSSQARRLVEQGGVKYKGNKVTDPDQKLQIEDGAVLQAGKRSFVKIFKKIS